MSCTTADVATFRILFPEFDPVADSTVQFYLDYYDCALSNLYWGNPASDPNSMKPEAILDLSAHDIERAQNAVGGSSTDSNGVVTTTTTSGPMTSASAGSISAGFATTVGSTQGNPANTQYSTTRGGQRFLALKYIKMPLALSSSCQPQV